MSDSKPAAKEQQEPSMEEILSSIRQIIASDEEESGKDKAAEEKGEGETETEEVLELTEVVPSEEAGGEKEQPAAKPEPAAKEVPAEAVEKPEEKPPAKPEPDLATLEKQVEAELAEKEADLELIDEPSPETMEDSGGAVTETEEEELVSGAAAQAATGAFARLAKTVARPEPEPPLAGDGKTVEQLVAELMRPMLKEWLDQHLPEIVERVVEREVRKLAKRAELM